MAIGQKPPEIEKEFEEETFQKTTFAHSLADWSNDSVKLVKALAERPNLTSMRDVALRYNPDKLVEIVDPENVTETTPGTTAARKVRILPLVYTANYSLSNLQPSYNGWCLRVKSQLLIHR